MAETNEMPNMNEARNRAVVNKGTAADPDRGPHDGILTPGGQQPGPVLKDGFNSANNSRGTDGSESQTAGYAKQTARSSTTGAPASDQAIEGESIFGKLDEEGRIRT